MKTTSTRSCSALKVYPAPYPEGTRDTRARKRPFHVALPGLAELPHSLWRRGDLEQQQRLLHFRAAGCAAEASDARVELQQVTDAPTPPPPPRVLQGEGTKRYAHMQMFVRTLHMFFVCTCKY